MEKYIKCMDSIHAPETLYAEVLNMTEKNRKTALRLNRRFISLIAAVLLLSALGTAAVAMGPSIFGWGGNFELRSIETEDGIMTEGRLHTDSLTEPVRFEDGRMIFIVNDEQIDITDEVSQTKPYLYEYTDSEGIIHYWIIGKNGPELENYGYGEFLYKEGESWIGGYSARTNIGPDGKSEPWLEKGKAELNIPW